MNQKMIIFAGILGAVLALPVSVFAATYGYVTTAGTLATVSASTPTEALLAAPGIAADSGVIILNSMPMAGNINLLSGTTGTSATMNMGSTGTSNTNTSGMTSTNTGTSNTASSTSGYMMSSTNTNNTTSSNNSMSSM